MEVGRPMLCLNLGRWSRRIEPRPEIILRIRIGEHIIVLHWPGSVCLLQCINISSWCWLDKLHIDRIVLVDIVDHLFHFLVVLLCILEGKITAPWQCNVVCTMDGIDKFVNIVNEFGHFHIGVEGLQAFICLKCVLVIHLEIRNPAVVVSKDTCQNLFLSSKVLGIWSP